MIKGIISTVLLSLIFANGFSQTIKDGYLSDDGAWCWFSDPRAIYVDGKVVTGWVKEDGSIETAWMDVKTDEKGYQTLFDKYEVDDHDNPSFALTKDGIMAFYCKHSSKGDIYMHKSYGHDVIDFSKETLFNPVSQEELKKYPKNTVTYSNPYTLKKEGGRTYCFGRWTGYKPNIMWSDNNGESWTKSKVFITNRPFSSGNRPYVKYHSDGKSKIHIIFTDGHPRNEPTNSVYYAYYENGGFYRVDGTLIADMASIPFEPKEATLVYKATEKNGRAWLADISSDKKGNPVILYSRSPEITDHRYHYARFDGKKWMDNEICKAGRWFPQTIEGKVEREPHYIGGLTVHPDNPNVVYLSKQVDGVFEIERHETSDLGLNWDTEAVTKKSKYDNVRPYIPRGLRQKDGEVVLWMENQKYIHYKIYRTSIKYRIRN